MTVTPYVMFNGNCEEALNFYAKALGGEIRDLKRMEGSPMETADNKNQVLHSHFYVNGNLLFMASDGNNTGVHTSGMVSLSLNITNPGQIENVFSQMADGGNTTMPLQDTFWGATFGMLTDQYGINWMFNFDKNRK